MFKFKSFLSLIIATICIVSYLHSATAYADDQTSERVASTVEMVNINTADAATIAAKLTGVGLKKAQAIVKYRTDFGAFHDVEELVEVKGIGKSIIAKNLDKISVE